MKIKINGKIKHLSDNIKTISGLIEHLNDKIPQLYAIEKNGKIIYKENYNTEYINDSDEIEIVMFCGGG